MQLWMTVGYLDYGNHMHFSSFCDLSLYFAWNNIWTIKDNNFSHNIGILPIHYNLGNNFLHLILWFLFMYIQLHQTNDLNPILCEKNTVLSRQATVWFFLKLTIATILKTNLRNCYPNLRYTKMMAKEALILWTLISYDLICLHSMFFFYLMHYSAL